MDPNPITKWLWGIKADEADNQVKRLRGVWSVLFGGVLMSGKTWRAVTWCGLARLGWARRGREESFF